MAVMTTCDGRWRVEVAGTDTAVLWHRLIGSDVDLWLLPTQALLAEFDLGGVDLADLREAVLWTRAPQWLLTEAPLPSAGQSGCAGLMTSGLLPLA